MNGSTENAASGAPGKSSGHDVVLLWSTARRMLPLVRRIVNDILHHERRLARLQAEKGRLDRTKRSLAWPERSRRYHLHQEIADCEHDMQDAAAELEVLGVVLLDAGEGRVGFPTRVNDAYAFLMAARRRRNLVLALRR